MVVEVVVVVVVFLVPLEEVVVGVEPVWGLLVAVEEAERAGVSRRRARFLPREAWVPPLEMAMESLVALVAAPWSLEWPVVLRLVVVTRA